MNSEFFYFFNAIKLKKKKRFLLCKLIFVELLFMNEVILIL